MKMVMKTIFGFLAFVLASGSVFALSKIPDDGRMTGKWPVAPPESYGGLTPFEKSALLLVGDPTVTMIEDWKAQIDFTTAIPAPAVTVYYGQYDEEGTLLPAPRFREFVREDLEGYSTEHSVTLDIGKLKRESRDINGMEDKNGGVVVYRLEIYYNSTGFSLVTPAARLYDRRFEFYNGQLVPTVTEGPFIDQITDSSAVLSWDTDFPVDGVVKLRSDKLETLDFEASMKNTTHFEVPMTGLQPGTTYNYSVQLTDGFNTTSSREFYFSTPALNAKKFTFAVMGDSREGYGGGEYQFNGVNAQIMGLLAAEAFDKNAEFILHTGDMINGYSDNALDFQMQLESFKDSVESVGHYLPIYEMMGNHEAVVSAYLASDKADNGQPSYGFMMATKTGDESAEVIFGNEFVNPTNGPDPDNVAANVPAGQSLPPYKENVYFFDYGNSRFVVMNNNYWYISYPEKFGGNLEGFVLDDQAQWLINLFNQTKDDGSIDHVFLFAQEPMFPAGGQADNAMWYEGGAADKNNGWDRTHVAERRDEIWRAFVGTGKAVAANFGDEHNYSRTLVTKDKDGVDFDYPVWQVISGGAGAPYAADFRDDLPWSDNVVKTSTQYSYTIFKVDGPRVKYEAFNIQGQLLDSVEMTKNPSSTGKGPSPLSSSKPMVDQGLTSIASGMSNQGNPLESGTAFEGVIDLTNVETPESKEVQTQFTIVPEAKDIGKKVELLLVLGSGSDYYMFNGNEWVEWNLDISALQPFQVVDQLPKVLDVSSGFVLATGQYQFHIGYRHEDGSIIYNGEPFNYTVPAGTLADSQIRQQAQPISNTMSPIQNIQQQLDKQAALELIYQYSYNWDGKNPEGFADLFTMDGIWEILDAGGQPVVKFEGRDAIRDYAANTFATNLADRQTQHYKTNTVFEEVSDSRIVAKTMVLIIHNVDGETAPRVALTGYVEHEFLKNSSGQWLIKRRSILSE